MNTINRLFSEICQQIKQFKDSKNDHLIPWQIACLISLAKNPKITQENRSIVGNLIIEFFPKLDIQCQDTHFSEFLNQQATRFEKLMGSSDSIYQFSSDVSKLTDNSYQKYSLEPCSGSWDTMQRTHYS